MTQQQTVGIHFRMTPERLVDLRERSAAIGISVQAYLELTMFGEIAQRQVNRRDSQIKDQEELPLKTA